jgi:hypothetical protein
MSLKYRPVKRINPANPNEPALFFPNPVCSEKISIRQLSKEMTAANVTEIRVKFRPGKEFASLVRSAELEKERKA